MNYMDTHLHLQDFKSKSATNIINDALKVGVDKFVCAAIIENDWQKIANLYEQYPDNIIPAFGLHPWYIREAQDGWSERLESFLQKYSQSLVGETGLDRYRDEDYEPQNEIFKKHIELSKKYGRPLLVHAVRCQDWLEDYWNILPQKFVFHSYNGRRELLKTIINHGGYVSFSSAILQNREKEKTLQAVHLERIMFETDGPYQSLHQGVEGEPKFIPELVKDIAQILNMNVNDLSSQAYKNSLEFIKPW